MVILVVVKAAVEDYGSTYDEDIVVLNHPPSPLKKMTTKWMVVCLLGLIAALMVLSSAVLFVSRRESSTILRAATGTEEAFLFHCKDGTCVVRSGAWPPGTTTALDGDSPFVACYELLDDDLVKNDLCWSQSFYSKYGNWNPCLSKGFGSAGWTAAYGRINDCGPPCTKFE